MRTLATRCRALVLAVLLAASTLPAPAVAQEPSLFERLGGLPAIESVVDQLLTNAAGDDRINAFFVGTDLANLRRLLVEQICAATGGPCTYTGRSMADAHRGLGITQAHFAALVEDLVAALDAFNVPEREKQELLLLLAPMAGDIIDTSLFARLGGTGAIEAVVDQFLANVAADARINRFFVGTDLANLRRLLVEQLCAASGGPCTYTGRSMRDAHAGMGITAGDFAALVEDLVAALDQFMVPEAEKGELLALLGPMQGDIVQAPTAAPTPAPAAPTPQAPRATSTVGVPPTPVPTAAPAPQTISVEIRGFAFNPATVTVPVGSTVRWTNADATMHTASGPGFDTGPLGRGQSGTATFRTAGTFNYVCNFHPNMRGTVIVQ